jgi:hypothetical protein
VAVLPLPDREQAREAAQRELEKRAYDEARPPLVTRVISWVIREIQELLNRATGSVPGGRVGVLLIVVLVLALVAVVVVRLRPTMRTTSFDQLFADGRALSADEHRVLAEAAASRGDHADAVRERLRAVVRHLEERGVLDVRPGRTAEEVTREAASEVPELAEPMRRGTRAFEEIWYGGQPAGPAAYAVLVEVDRVVSTARLVSR